MKCNKCNYENNEPVRFCGKCGAVLQKKVNSVEENDLSNKKQKKQGNKKVLIILLIVFLLLAVGVLIVLLNNKNDNDLENKKIIIKFEKKNLVKDNFVIDHYQDNKVYECNYMIPKYMSKDSDTLKGASYLFQNKNYKLVINYGYYEEENDLKYFKDSEEFKTEKNYNYYKSDSLIKVYFKNNKNMYQTVEISVFSLDGTDYVFDNSYKNLLSDMNIKNVGKEKYSITKSGNNYEGNLNYNYYVDEDNKMAIKASYKVSAEKYGSNYDSVNSNFQLYTNDSKINFYEGEITKDLSSVKNQSKINIYFVTENNLDLKQDAVSSLEWAVNQTAFTNVDENNVNISIDKFNYNEYEVNYYHIKSDNKNSHNERIKGYLKIKDNLYYVVQIYGGDSKELSSEMLKEFLPINIVIK